MKFSAVAALTVAALANAQSRSDIPSCALPCLDNAIKKNTQCSTDDIACVCKNFESIQGSATSCVLKECGQDVALTKVLPATQALCKNPGGGSKPSGSASPSAPTTQQPSESAQPSQPAQSSEPAEPSESAEPSEPAESSGSAQPTQPAQQTTPCDTTLMPTVAPTGAPIAPSNGTLPTAPIVTAGAAGVAPVGGLALLALGAFLL